MRSRIAQVLASSAIALLVLLVAACGAQPTPPPTATPDVRATTVAIAAASTAQANGEATRIAVAVSQALTAAAPTITPTPTLTPVPTSTVTPTETVTPEPTDTPAPTDTLPPTNTPRPRLTDTPEPQLNVSLRVIGYQPDGMPYIADDGTCWSSLTKPAKLLTVEVIVTNLSSRNVIHGDWGRVQALNNAGAPALMACYYHTEPPPIPPGATGVKAIKVWVENGQYVKRIWFRMRGVDYQECYDIVPRVVACN